MLAVCEVIPLAHRHQGEVVSHPSSNKSTLICVCVTGAQECEVG